MSLLEAMSVGCCCVAFDCETGPNEIIIDGKNGLLARAEDVNDLVEKLKWIMSDNDMRKDLSRKASDSLASYSVNKIVGLWIKLLNDVKSR